MQTRTNSASIARIAAGRPRTWHGIHPWLLLLLPLLLWSLTAATAHAGGASAAALAPAPAVIGATSGAAGPAADSLYAADEAKEPIVLDGRTLFHVASVGGYPAATRAAAINQRLLEVARDRTLSPDSITVVETEAGAEIRLGTRTIMGVFWPDSRPLGTSPRAAAAAFATLMRKEIERYREAYSPEKVTTGIAKAVAYTLLLVLLLYLTSRAGRWIHARVERWLVPREEKLTARTKQLVSLRHLTSVTDALFHLGGVAILLVLAYLYVYAVLNSLPWTRSVSSHLFLLISEPFNDFIDAFGRRLPGLFFVAVVAFCTYYLLRFCRFLFLQVESGHIEIRGFYPEWAMATYKILRILIAALALVVAYPYIPGSDSAAFKGISIFFGVLLSLGSTSGVSNAVAGVMLLYMRGFHVGDIVEIAGHRGEVIESSMLATRLRTPKNLVITMPNSTVMGSNIINYSAMAREKRLILPTVVGVGYNAPWRQVHALLLQAAGRTEGVLAEPAPFVLQRSLDAFCVTYELNVYVDQPNRILRTYSDLHKHIQDAFNEYGVEIMTPAYEGDRATPTYVPKDRWYAPPAKPPGAPGADA